MSIPLHILFAFLVWIFPLESESVPKLDIFDSGQPFDKEIIPGIQGIPSLNYEKGEQVSNIIKIYLSSLNNEKNRIQKNLISLAIGNLYLNQKKYPEAVKILEKNIIGNFILEDYRLYFLATALKEMGKMYLENKKWLCGNYSIADIANWSWVRIYFWSGIHLDGLDNLTRWMKNMEKRPACKKGIEIPKREKSSKVVNNAKNMVQT